MTRRILDLFSGAGGAAVGYTRAGFTVVGVDIAGQPNYPFEFHQCDAMSFVREHGHRFDAIHASPPCQANIAITAGNRGRSGWTDDHVNLIPPTREALARFDVPTVIENGISDQLRPDVTLCGLMFGLPTLRDRYFELDKWTATAPDHPSHRGHLTVGWRHGCRRTPEPGSCPKHGTWCRGTVYGVYGNGGGKPTIPQAQHALGIEWTDVRAELNEAIPPAYTEHLGRQLMEVLT